VENEGGGWCGDDEMMQRRGSWKLNA